MTPLSRRQFLIAGASTAALVACSSDPPAASPAPEIVLVSFVAPQTLAAGGRVRAPFSLANADGVPLREGLPETLAVSIIDGNGEPVVTGGQVKRHDAGLPRGYFPVEFDAAAPGFYDLMTEVDGIELSASFGVSDPEQVAIPNPGDAMPSLPTPTLDNPLGVEPICTRTPSCPFHDRSLDEALAAGEPILYFVGSPEHCTTAICGPTLDVLIDAQSTLGGITVIHQEVFSDAAGQTLTDAVTQLGYTFEPSLIAIDAAGIVTKRLDVIFDADELATSMAAISAS